ncbi:DUF397 domain-containing protein [Streptomyces sp. NPDC046465]|uniref:DUF397 domain-containing protein n=1 Tax=Streptomyces sp. NPDC046465 TaxID=3155810 RepID=UPI00340D37AC
MSGELHWFKSSYSDDEGANCLEVALSRSIHIRDSKLPASPEIQVHASAWATFIAAVQPGA